MFSLVTLCLMLCLRACLCCVMYGALRLLGTRSPLALRGLGWFALVLWASGFVFFALMECLLAEGFSSGEPEPQITYPVAFITNVGLALGTTLGVGGFLLRYATQKQLNWWQGVLFCALYVMAAHLLASWVITGMGYIETLSRGLHHPVSPYSLFIWLFPLGAPAAEIALHSFRRSWVANREGYPL